MSEKRATEGYTHWKFTTEISRTVEDVSRYPNEQNDGEAYIGIFEF